MKKVLVQFKAEVFDHIERDFARDAGENHYTMPGLIFVKLSDSEYCNPDKKGILTGKIKDYVKTLINPEHTIEQVAFEITEEI